MTHYVNKFSKREKIFYRLHKSIRGIYKFEYKSLLKRNN